MGSLWWFSRHLPRLAVPGCDEAPEVLRRQGPRQRQAAAAPDLGHLEIHHFGLKMFEDDWRFFRMILDDTWCDCDIYRLIYCHVLHHMIHICWLKDIFFTSCKRICSISRAALFSLEPKTHTSSSTSSWGSGRIPRKISLQEFRH